MLKTATDVTQEKHSDSTSTVNPDSKIIIKAKQLHVNAKLIGLKNEKQCSRTSTLWFQYMRMVDILKLFIQAEGTGDWDFHLVARHAMLPYFAAAAHNLYTKSVYLYVQQMLSLPVDHPNVYSMLVEGHHVIRRRDRYTGQVCQEIS